MADEAPAMGEELLVITRSDMLKRLVEAGLSGQDVQVGVASELGEIYSYADRHKPKAVVYDLVNPIKEEFIRIKALKSHENLKEAPVVFIAGSPRLLFRHQLVGPKDTFVMRYLESKTLVQKIKELLGAPVEEEYVEPAVAVLEGVAPPAAWAEELAEEVALAEAEFSEEIMAEGREAAVPSSLPMYVAEMVTETEVTHAGFEVAETLEHRPEEMIPDLQTSEVGQPEVAPSLEAGPEVLEPGLALAPEVESQKEAGLCLELYGEEKLELEEPAQGQVAIFEAEARAEELAQVKLEAELVTETVVQERVESAPYEEAEKEEPLEFPPIEAMEEKISQEVREEVAVEQIAMEPLAVEVEPGLKAEEEEIVEEASVVMEEEVQPRPAFDATRALEMVVSNLKASLREEMEKIAERAARKVLAEWLEKGESRKTRLRRR